MIGSQVREQESLRLKGKLGISGSGSMSGSGKFNQKFMRSITMSPGGATWQVCSLLFSLAAVSMNLTLPLLWMLV